MRTGSPNIAFQRHRDRSRLNTRLKKARSLRERRVELEGLESRTLMATTPAAAYNGALQQLTGSTNVTTGGNANNPTVAVDPFNSQHLFAVWGVDLSTITPTPPHTTAVVRGAFSTDGGMSWLSVGGIGFPELDPLTVNATPPTSYTQVTSPSVAFDGAGHVYVLTMQSTGAADGAIVLNTFSFGSFSSSQQNVYQWVTNSDAATTPTLAVDPGTFPSSVTTPPSGIPIDPFRNNVYIAWASIDATPALPPNPITLFNPNRAEIVVGTPVFSIAGAPSNEAPLAFSGVRTVSPGGNFGNQRNAHPVLAINPISPTSPGQVVIGWEDDGSLATLSPPLSILQTSFVQPGNAYGFNGGTGFIAGAASNNSPGNWGTATVYSAGIASSSSAANPVGIAVGVNVNGVEHERRWRKRQRHHRGRSGYRTDGCPAQHRKRDIRAHGGFARERQSVRRGAG